MFEIRRTLDEVDGLFEKAVHDVRTEDRRHDETPSAPIRRPAEKVGRNDPCPCGSGKKYKQCCLKLG